MGRLKLASELVDSEGEKCPIPPPQAGGRKGVLSCHSRHIIWTIYASLHKWNIAPFSSRAVSGVFFLGGGSTIPCQGADGGTRSSLKIPSGFDTAYCLMNPQNMRMEWSTEPQRHTTAQQIETNATIGPECTIHDTTIQSNPIQSDTDCDKI